MMKIIYQEVIDFPTVDHFVHCCLLKLVYPIFKDLFSPIMIIMLFTPAALFYLFSPYRNKFYKVFLGNVDNIIC